MIQHKFLKDLAEGKVLVEPCNKQFECLVTGDKFISPVTVTFAVGTKQELCYSGFKSLDLILESHYAGV